MADFGLESAVVGSNTTDMHVGHMFCDVCRSALDRAMATRAAVAAAAAGGPSTAIRRQQSTLDMVEKRVKRKRKRKMVSNT